MTPSTIADTFKCLDVAGRAYPSAIAAFSDLIFPVHSKETWMEPGLLTTLAVRTTSEHRSSVGIGDLPTELLLSIFRCVFETCVNSCKADTNSQCTTAWLEDDPLSTSLFPYSLASVCVRWLHILSDVALYWTRQVIMVDSRAISLIATRTLLLWAGDLPLQLVVTRDPHISGEIDEDEGATIQGVIDLLQPHIHHTWSLTFDVRYYSSLPALLRGQGGGQHHGALSPTSLCSDTRSVTGPSRTPEPDSASNGSRFKTSTRARFLEEVAFDRYCFNDAQFSGKQDNFMFCNITFLTICGYTTSNGSRISLHQFIATIQTCKLLQKLAVEDISFVNDVHPSRKFRLDVPVICLRRIAGGDAVGSIVSQAFGIRMKELVTISDSPFDGLGKRSSSREKLSSVNLVLDGVDAGAIAIRQLVCFWNGENLSLVNCPGVSASFLRGIPTEETPLELRCLRIVDCENASTEGLMALVKSREIQSAIDALALGDPDEGSCVALVELHVHGRGPAVNAEQAVWFAKHLETFSWGTTASDGMQYTWDASACQLVVLPAHN